METEPTIVLQIDHAWCLNCKKRVSTVYARRHIFVDEFHTPGCGVEFKYVTTAYAGHKDKVAKFRDDLQWKDVQWAA